MDLRYDTEQEILRDSANKFLAAHCDYQSFLATSESDVGFAQDLWTEFAYLGWLGLAFSADDGGIGAGAVELSILMEAFGKHLVLAPYLATVILGGGLLSLLGSSAERAEILPDVMEGKCRLAFAHEDLDESSTAAQTSSGYALTGRKRNVLSATAADIVFVSAKLENGRLGLFKVDRERPGVTLRPYTLVDGTRAANIDFDNVGLTSGALIGGNEDVEAAIQTVIDRAICSLSADAVGAIAAVMEATLDYTRTRVQFGRPIANFQAIQHRLVEMKIRQEEARSICLLATLSVDRGAGERARAISGAKAKIGRCARFIYQNAIQLHGGIGTTKELALGGYVRRLVAYEGMFGPTRQHLRRYANLIASPEAAAKPLMIAPAD